MGNLLRVLNEKGTVPKVEFFVDFESKYQHAYKEMRERERTEWGDEREKKKAYCTMLPDRFYTLPTSYLFSSHVECCCEGWEGRAQWNIQQLVLLLMLCMCSATCSAVTRRVEGGRE